MRRIRPVRALVVLAAVVLALGAGGWWLRDSSIFAVRQVSVTGASGPEAPLVRSALRAAALRMTTLDVQHGRLLAAVRSYRAVKALHVHARLFHRLAVEVVEYRPVAALLVGGRRTAVASDGSLLPERATTGLPTIAASRVPSGKRVTDASVRGAVAAAAAAPARLRALVVGIGGDAGGLQADLQGGVRLMLGSGERLPAKWAAAARVLAAPAAAGASYLDVRMPERPVAGGFAAGTPASPATSSST